MNAESLNRFKTFSAHQRVLRETLDERRVVATLSLHTLGERYSIVVHVRVGVDYNHNRRLRNLLHCNHNHKS